jgi:hypothetical protein
MLPYDATAIAALNSTVRTAVFLFEFDFTTGLQFWTNWARSIDANTGSGSGTVTYNKGPIAVTNLVNSEDPANEKLRISIPMTSQAMFAAAVGDATTYRNRSMRLYVQILNSTQQPAGAPVIHYDGVMDKHVVERDSGQRHGGAMSGRITLMCAKRGLSFARRATGLRLTDAQQQAEFAGDKGAEYIADMIEKPTLWLSVNFQRQP